MADPTPSLEDVGGLTGSSHLRNFLAVSHNDDGTLKNLGATILSAVLSAGNDAGGHTITDLAAPVNPSDAVTKAYADALVVTASALQAVLTAGNNAGGLGITNLLDPVLAQDAATKHYVDTQDAATSTLNSVLTASNDAGAHTITNLGAPTVTTDAVTKAYADALRLTLSQVLTAGGDAGALRITNLGTPISTNDAATKAYVDSTSGAAHSLAQVLAVGADAGAITITDAGTPVNQSDVATKDYVDCLTLNNQSASYTLVATDVGKCVNFTGSTAATLTVPPNSSVPFEISPRVTRIVVSQGGTGQVTVSPGAGVTLKNPFNAGATSFTTAAQYAEIILTKIGTDTWRVNGEVT